MMAWLQSRRLRYLAGVTLIWLLLFVLLRAVFLLFFTEPAARAAVPAEVVRETFWIGIKFDLRIAILLTLPLLLVLTRFFHIDRHTWAKRIAEAYLLLAVLVVLLIYFIDFGYYNYLGVRINSTVYRYFKDAAISAEMLWQSYPVITITLGWLAVAALIWLAFRWWARRSLQREPAPMGKLARRVGMVVAGVLFGFGIFGRFSHINIENPVPLRWNEAFFSGNPAVAALGLNPVQFLYDTSLTPQEDYNVGLVRDYYAPVAKQMGLPEQPSEPITFAREVPVAPHKLSFERTPNVVFIMLESLGASRVSGYGLPYPSTPNLDALMQHGWKFEHFYIPVVGTAKTVWASITGIPDVAKVESATRNPLISRQQLVLNAFTEHEKYYFIGGSADWANMSALIKQSIPGIKMYEEGDWKAPNVDVWGISDLDLFKETDAILRTLPKDKPFFAYIQTAGNHRPYTIPKNSDDFVIANDDEAELAKWGFQNRAQYNAVRLLDYSIGRFFEMAKQSGYHDDTIFVLFGDHNSRITTIPHMAKFQEALLLESHHVPGIIYAPKYLSPRVIREAVSLTDMVPTVAGMLGIPYRNTTLGRDIQSLTPEQEGAWVMPVEGAYPQIGFVTQDYMARMNHDGSQASLHQLYSDDPLKDLSQAEPERFADLAGKARGYYEASRYLFYQNVVPADGKPGQLATAKPNDAGVAPPAASAP